MQKTALRTEADNRVKEVQLELEAARTVSASLGVDYLLLKLSSTFLEFASVTFVAVFFATSSIILKNLSINVISCTSLD